MPVNRNALIRYRTIDTCLRNRLRKWTLEDLIEACSDALYEYEGIDKGVSKRTVQQDIQMMRSEKLGYNAPIVVIDRKYYTYENPEYSISNIPLTDQDLDKLTEVIGILKQFNGFTHFQELSSMVQRLEDKVYTERNKQESVIQFETNENLKGIEYLDTLYQAIIRRKAILLTYQSFKARASQSFHYHPQLLKEFRNRWFVLGFKGKSQQPLILALDRIIQIQASDQAFIENTTINLGDFFKDVLGVSVQENGKPELIEIFIEQAHAPYILTKPIHHSQKVKRRLPGGVVITLEVQLNFELEKELLGYGENIKVLGPDMLVRRMKKRMALCYQLYTKDIHPVVAEETIKRVDRRGFALVECIYNSREISKITQLLEAQKIQNEGYQLSFAIPHVLSKIPALKPLLFNQKMHTLISEGLGTTYFLCNSSYFLQADPADSDEDWHQDLIIEVKEKVEAEGFTGWTNTSDAARVVPPTTILKNIYTLNVYLDDAIAEKGAQEIIPKSHFKLLRREEIKSLQTSKEPTSCELEAGGVVFLKPLTLRKAAKSTSNQACRVIQLLFASVELPNGLEWVEREFV